MTNWKTILMCAVSLLTIQPAQASIFSTSSAGTFGFHCFIGSCGLFTVDSSNMSVSDTPDGMRISGFVTMQTQGATGFGPALWQFGAYRSLAIPEFPVVTDLVLSSQLDATVTTSGGINVYGLVGDTFTSFRTNGTSCEAVNTAGGQPADVVTGAVSVGPNMDFCQTYVSGGYGLLNLVGYISVNQIPNVPATVRVDFGSSLLGEARLADTGQVPEPSAGLMLLSGAALLAVGRFLRKG